MAGLLRLSVITPDQALLQVEDAARVRLKLADLAWLSIYPGHAPLLAEVLPGPVQYDTELETGEIEIGSAILFVTNNVVTILASGQRELGDEAPDEELTGSLRFDRLAGELLAALRAQEGLSSRETPWVDGLGDVTDEA